MADKIAVVGAGLIGRAWSISFARAGHQVALYDPDADALANAYPAILDLLANLESASLLRGQAAHEVGGRIALAEDLASAVKGAVHVQENAPEKIEVKRELFQKLDRLAPPAAVLASSSSALLPSRFTEGLAGRARCLVAHPINPPYLVPAVELVPAPWTAHETMARTKVLMEGAFQAVITMAREIEGFIMNRLQAALVQEAYRLAQEGYASVEDIDIGVRKGIGLRWAFMGPFETCDLNAPGGIVDYAARYGGAFAAIGKTQVTPPPWSGPSLAAIEADRAKALPRKDVAARQHWRDLRLMALMRHLRDDELDIGA